MRVVVLGVLTLTLAACANEARCGRAQFAVGPWIDAGPGDSVRGWTQVTPGPPDTLRFGYSLANFQDRPVHYQLTGCLAGLRAHRKQERSGPAVWELRRGHPEVCVAAGEGDRTLAPGDTVPTRRVSEALLVSQILGDSLPEGRYYFSVAPGLELGPEFTTRSDSLERIYPRTTLYAPAGSTVLCTTAFTQEAAGRAHLLEW